MDLLFVVVPKHELSIYSFFWVCVNWYVIYCKWGNMWGLLFCFLVLMVFF